MTKYWYNMTKYLNLLRTLVGRDIKLKYKNSYLGMLWTLLNPILMMIILTIVFSTIFEKNIPNFPVYLLSGRILFEFYSMATKTAMKAVIGGASLIKKVYVPKYIFPISKVLSAFVNLLFSMIALVLVMIVTKVPFSFTQLLFPIPLIYLLVFSMGVGLILSSYTVFFRDIEHLYGVLLTAWTYATPIFYPAEIIPEEFQAILTYNPLHHIIKMFRDIMIYNTVPDLMSNLICMTFSGVTFLLGLYLFYKKQDKFILYI